MGKDTMPGPFEAYREATQPAPAPLPEEVERAISRLSGECLSAGREGMETMVTDAGRVRLLLAHITSQARRLAEVEAEVQNRRQWKDTEDHDDAHTAAIDAAHPCNTGKHALYANALEMVGNRYSKYALVDLVNWLLARAEAAKARVKELESGVGMVQYRRLQAQLREAEARVRELEDAMRDIRLFVAGEALPTKKRALEIIDANLAVTEPSA